MSTLATALQARPEPPAVDNWPEPLALWLPFETMTVTAPFAPTLPDTLNEASPA